MDKVKYPNISVELVGEDGNAFSILGRCKQAMRRAGCTSEQVLEFQNEATSGDYDHLLQTVIKYFNIAGDEEYEDKDDDDEGYDDDDQDDDDDYDELWEDDEGNEDFID